MTTEPRQTESTPKPTPDTGLALYQQLALKTAATCLGEEFRGVYSSETIERFLDSSFDQFADRATVAKFLPLLAEH